MILEIKVPSPGESITEVEIARWLKSNGDQVQKDEEICEIDSDKATLAIAAEGTGKLEILFEAGKTVKVGEVLCRIDTSASGKIVVSEMADGKEKKERIKVEQPPVVSKVVAEKKTEPTGYAAGFPAPAAAKLMEEKSVQAGQVAATGKGGRITKDDVVRHLASGFSAPSNGWGGTRNEERKKMSSLRRKLARRLVAVKNQTAMLTTFNEVDMSAIFDIRNKYKDKFKEKYGVGLGFMSFFTKAVTGALSQFPQVNAMIDAEDIVFYNYADIGIAVSAPKGLMVPVLRNTEMMSLADIELKIKELAVKARDGKLTVEEMTGGTFTITNGGVFGSMLSTPILNPPQSAILGMHNIVERAVVVKGKIEVRPVMYLALSYDHRIIDGKESVSFLVKVKELLEDPVKMLFTAKSPVEVLLGTD